MLGVSLHSRVLELRTLGLEASLDVRVVTVFEFAVLDRSHVVVVLLWKLLGVVDWLDCGVVVVLVDLPVNGSSDILVTVLVDGLVGNCRGSSLVDGGVVVTGLGHEALDCVLSGIHCGVMLEKFNAL